MNAVGVVNSIESGGQRFRREFPDAEIYSSMGAVENSPPLLPWLVLGGVGAIIIWMLTRKQIRETVTGAIAPIEPPAAFASLGAVATRFDQVRELYRMGYLTPEKALDELAVLSAAAVDLQEKGRADPTSTQDIITRMARFGEDIFEFISPAVA